MIITCIVNDKYNVVTLYFLCMLLQVMDRVTISHHAPHVGNAEHQASALTVANHEEGIQPTVMVANHEEGVQPAVMAANHKEGIQPAVMAANPKEDIVQPAAMIANPDETMQVIR